MRSALSLALVAMLAAGCTNRSQQAVTFPTELIVDRVSCEESIAIMEALPEGTRIGPLGLVAISDSTAALGRTGPDNDLNSSRRFAKIALFTKHSNTFSVFIGSKSQGTSLLEWGDDKSSAPGFAVEFHTCSGSGWSVYAGGIWVFDPSCVQLVIVDTRTSDHAEFSVPVGVACDEPTT